MLLIVGLLAGFSTVFAADPEPVKTTLGLHDYDLPGYLNLALGKEATSSDNCAHDGTAAGNVTDGKLEDTTDLGWDTYGSDGVAWLQVDLAGVCNISRVVVYPFWSTTGVNLGDWTTDGVGKHFPGAYELQVSTDGKNFTTVDKYTNPDVQGSVDGAVIHDFKEVEARYVRINVTAPGSNFTAFGTTRPHSRIGEINVYGFSRDLTIYDPYKPDAVHSNIALNKMAVSDNDYALWGMAAANTTDGKLQTANTYGWSTTVSSSGDSSAGIGNLTVDLESEATVSRFVVYPFYINNDVGVFFPKAYDVQVSTDDETWTTVATKSGNQKVVRPQIIDLENAVNARYVRLHVTESGYSEGNGYCSQVGELSVYGIYNSKAAVINKTALRMNPGDEDYLKFTYYGVGEMKLTFASSNHNVVTVSDTGKVVAVADGTATITVDDATTGGQYEVSVLVDDYKPTENLMITAFWSIQEENMNADYMDKLKEAGITNIQINFTQDTANYADNMAIAKMAYERGIGVTVGEKAWGWGRIGSFSDDKIYNEALKYSHVPGVIGYYVIDEPANASDFAHCFAPIKKAMPSADVHLNFVPNVGNMTSLLDQVNGNLDYLMWDSYIWPTTGCSESVLFNNSNAMRKLALEYGVKTGQFIQSCTYSPTMRKPNGNEIRYNVNAALAYGNKQLAYFYYRIPVVESQETYSPGIINADGTKTEIYDDVAAIDAAALKLGPTLMQLEALDVYHTGKESGANTPLPADFYLQPADGTDLIVSYMRNNTTKQNYVMLVNRDYEKSASVSFTVDKSITSLQYVSDKTGALVAMQGNGQTYSCELVPGGCILLKMPDGIDYTPDYGKTVETPAGKNSAVNAKTSASNKILADGARISDSTAKVPNVWTAAASENTPATAEFSYDKINQTINRVDLYPNDLAKFPSDFKIEVTTDGTTWTPVVEKTGFKLDSAKAASFTFDSVSAKGLRLVATAPANIELCEIEIYNDNGTVAAPVQNAGYPVDAARQPGDNLGRHAKVIFSSMHPQGAPYWQPELIHDGIGYDAIYSQSNAGWSSIFPGHGTATELEWVGYDLGEAKRINKAVVFNAWPTLAECYPCDYEVQVSMNGKDWTTVSSVQNDTNFTKVGARVLSFDTVSARYVRFCGTRQSAITQGFGMQLSELEVYESTAPAYEVSVNTPVNGKATVSPSSAEKGQRVTVSATPDDGYELDSITACGADGALLTVTNGSFVMPESKVTITVTFREKQYQIAVSAAAHGTLRTDCSTAAKGATITVTAEPETGYSLKSLHVTDHDGNEIALTKNQFVMPASDVTVTASFKSSSVPGGTGGKESTGTGSTTKPAQSESLPFHDVADNAWYHDAVKFVFENHVMNGTGTNEFSPERSIDRAMFVTTLYRMALEPDVQSSVTFKDVDQAAYYAKAVAWAQTVKVVNGYGDGTIRPNEKITREQLAAMLYRYAMQSGCDCSKLSALDKFADAKQVSAYALKAMQWAVAAGLIEGANGKLNPQGYVIRAELATILMRFHELYLK